MLKYDKQRKRLVNIAVDNRSSPFYALRDRQGNAIGVTACDIDGDGREEIYVLNTNNAFSGTVQFYTDAPHYHTSFFVQRQSRRISMQILKLISSESSSDNRKLCAAINQSESYRAHTDKTKTAHFYHLYENYKGHFQTVVVNNHLRFFVA